MPSKVKSFRRNIFLLAAAMLILPGMALAQVEDDSPTIVYNSQVMGGLTIHTNGWGGFFQMGKYKGVKKVLLLNLDVVNMKHEKEVKSYNPVYEDSRSYVYGKVNNFYVIRPMIGRKKILSRKERRSGVQVGYTWMFGPSIGITKPVYLEIGYPSIPYDYLAVERYDPDRHFFDDIYGRASGLRGFSELGIEPGVSAKFAMNFEYSNQKDRLKGLEAGATMDLYFRQVPIMAEEYIENNRQYFLTLYLNLFFGKKFIQR